MEPPRHTQDKLDRLRRWRNRPDRDVSMGFLQKMFKQQVEKPYKQLAGVSQAWQALLPAELLAHTRLDRLQRGVLHVSVADSGRLYELDRMLRSGLERELITACGRGGLRRVRLQVAPLADDEPTR